jgi:predicted dehydrogenase
MKSLVVGMGIGNLYKAVLQELGSKVVTVDRDPSKGADFNDVDMAIAAHGGFDTVHICTPNFTHMSIARKVAALSRIVFIEKPGVANEEAWVQLVKDYPATRIMMVKNNQWRKTIGRMKEFAKDSSKIHINWINKDRVPSPGSWFTTKSLSYGGVSRDLMPHLLSLFMALEPDYAKATEIANVAVQNWTLDDLTNTDYGTVNPNGTYDVDDMFYLGFEINDRQWHLTANWRCGTHDDVAIHFGNKDAELGLCPEEAYKEMILDALQNIGNDEFWQNQYVQDCWIHSKIDL